MREFRRFAKIGSSTFDWTLGLVKNVDAVIFEARKPVRIFGIGIYGPFGGVQKQNFIIRYKWLIESSPNGEVLQESDEYEEHSSTPEPKDMIEGKYFHYKF